MICKNCNQENESGAKFCRYCGSPLNGEEQKYESTEASQYNQAPPQYNTQQPNYGQPPYPGAVPPPYGNQPPMPQINQSTYLIWAILTTLFCC